MTIYSWTKSCPVTKRVESDHMGGARVDFHCCVVSGRVVIEPRAVQDWAGLRLSTEGHVAPTSPHWEWPMPATGSFPV